MIHNYSKVKISNLLINPEFDYKSSGKNISLDSEGISISIKELNFIRSVSGIDSIENLYESNYKLCNQLNINSSDKIEWDKMLGKNICRNYTKDLLSKINFSKNLITTYHTQILKKRMSLYKNLSQILDSDNNKIEIPDYNHFGISGRTSIKSGYNFLSSSKEFRKNCKSQIKGNMLVSIDFKSCEPNLYLRSLGKNINNSDIYEYLMNELSLDVSDRDSLKRGILAVLYGASDSTVKRILSGKNDYLNKLKEFFEIKNTTQKLEKEFAEKQFIFNMYGRPIVSDKSILNKWIQSSAVDFCSLAFLNFINEFKLKVAYLVHDDMVVDCSIEEYNRIKNIKEIKDNISNISLPVEITVLGS